MTEPTADISSVHMQPLETDKKKLEEFVALQNIKETGCDDKFVVCNDAYHGVGNSIQGVHYS